MGTETFSLHSKVEGSYRRIKMKPAILLSVFAVAILSIALAEEEVQVSDSDRSLSRERRTPRGGNRLLSLYLKPPGSSIDNLKKAWGVYKPKGRVQKPGASKGKRLLSVSLKRKNPNAPQPKVPNNIYTRAFQRFSDDFQRNGHRALHRTRSNQRIARPGPRAQGRPRYRSRRAPVRRPIRNYRKRVGRTNPHGKEIFSLFLKKPVASRRVPLGGRYAPAKADLPLICKFQPKKCGAKGKKLFSIY